MQDRSRLSPLERFLSTFTDIHPGEGKTGLILFANVFLILCAYYFIKPLRDSWIAVSTIEGLSTMEIKAYSSFAQSILLAGVASVFARMSSRMPRRKLLTGSSLFCMTNLVAFWTLQPGLFFENLPFAGVFFYLWVGMFGVFIVAQFWTLAADLYAGERGTRLLPLIAIGATAGAASGSYVTGFLVESGLFDSSSLLLFANVPLGLSIFLTRKADQRGPLGDGSAGPAEAQPSGDAEAEPAGAATAKAQPSGAVPPKAAPAGAAVAKDDDAAKKAKSGAIFFILGHRYLLSVALVVMLANWVNTNGENLLFRVLQDSLLAEAAAQGITGDVPVKDFLGEQTAVFYGNLFFWVNVIALFAQSFLASRLLRYGGFGAIMLLLPGIALVSYSTMAVLPVLAVVRLFKIAENATDYSINNTARQVLWLPTTSETKYRAKPAVDSLFVRLGDGFAALTVLVGVQFLELSTRAFFVVNVVLVLGWLLLSWSIVRMYAEMVAASKERGAV